MDANLGLEISESVLAAHAQGGGFDAGFVPELDVHDFGGQSAALHPSLIHAKKHIRPIAGFRSSGAGVNGEERRIAIKFPREEGSDFKFVEVALNCFEFRPDFLGGSGLVFWGFLQGEFAKDIEVCSAGFEALKRVDLPSERGDFGDIPLGFFPVVPKIRLVHPGFDFREFAGQFRQVKETSATQPGGL